jgi:hypothetical protein
LRPEINERRSSGDQGQAKIPPLGERAPTTVSDGSRRIAERLGDGGGGRDGSDVLTVDGDQGFSRSEPVSDETGREIAEDMTVAPSGVPPQPNEM